MGEEHGLELTKTVQTPLTSKGGAFTFYMSNQVMIIIERSDCQKEEIIPCEYTSCPKDDKGKLKFD